MCEGFAGFGGGTFAFARSGGGCGVVVVVVGGVLGSFRGVGDAGGGSRGCGG